MSDWREMTLGDLIEVDHGFAFQGALFSEGGLQKDEAPLNALRQAGVVAEFDYISST